MRQQSSGKKKYTICEKVYPPDKEHNLSHLHRSAKIGATKQDIRLFTQKLLRYLGKEYTDNVVFSSKVFTTKYDEKFLCDATRPKKNLEVISDHSRNTNSPLDDMHKVTEQMGLVFNGIPFWKDVPIVVQDVISSFSMVLKAINIERSFKALSLIGGIL